MTRCKFYSRTDLPGSVEELKPLIDNGQVTYNFTRPHGAFFGLIKRLPEINDAADRASLELSTRYVGYSQA